MVNLVMSCIYLQLRSVAWAAAIFHNIRDAAQHTSVLLLLLLFAARLDG